MIAKFLQLKSLSYCRQLYSPVFGVHILLLCLVWEIGCLRSFIYQPTQLNDTEINTLVRDRGWERVTQRLGPDIYLNGLIKQSASPKSPWLIFFGGNAMNLQMSQSVLNRIAQNRLWGLAVWAYRGYDGSTGNPKEDDLIADAEAHVAYILRRFALNENHLFVIGQSLGSGIATQVVARASNRNLLFGGLILVSAYTSLDAVVDDMVPIFPLGWAVADTYATIDLMHKINLPVLLIHGRKDDTISVQHSRRLMQQLGKRGRLVEIPRAGHNDIWEYEKSAQIIRRFIEQNSVALD